MHTNGLGGANSTTAPFGECLIPQPTVDSCLPPDEFPPFADTTTIN